MSSYVEHSYMHGHNGYRIVFEGIPGKPSWSLPAHFKEYYEALQAAQDIEKYFTIDTEILFCATCQTTTHNPESESDLNTHCDECFNAQLECQTCNSTLEDSERVCAECTVEAEATDAPSAD